MLALIYGFIFLLFLGSAAVMDRKAERGLWLRLILYFIAGSFILRINQISLPIGFIIGILYMGYKSNNNRSIKYLGLMFGLAFYFLSIIIPDHSLNNAKEDREVAELQQKFDHLTSITKYTPNSDIQQTINRINLENPSDEYKSGDTIVMFRTWVLDARHIPIKSPDWLWRCDDELHLYWLSQMKDENTQYELIQFNEDHKTYFGVFKRKDAKSPFYLKYVIESKGTKERLNHDEFFPALNF